MSIRQSALKQREKSNPFFSSSRFFYIMTLVLMLNCPFKSGRNLQGRSVVIEIQRIESKKVEEQLLSDHRAKYT